MDSVGVTRPVTLSGWLIGVGAGLAAIGALVALFDGIRTVVDLLVLVAMAAVAVSVFFSSRLPAFGHLRLATLALADHHTKRELRWAATHDPLTGLINRAEFERRLDRAADREAHRHVGGHR